MATITSGRPAWQRGAVFQFFASLKLAVVLLIVLVVASIAGTIYESSFDAKVARAYVYGAPWFNLWLVLLGANLAVSALSRWPWQKHHVAFLVTHLGIITLLTGSLIGRIWGLEGTITLFKGEAPVTRLLVDERQLRVFDSDGLVKGYRAEFLHRKPTTEHPYNLGRLASGARLSISGYADAIDARLNPRLVAANGVPALHFVISSAMMGQHLESWLLADGEAQHASYSLGLANIDLKRGAVSSKSKLPPVEDIAADRPTAETDLEESIFVFSNAPEQQISHVVRGGSTGARLSLSHPQKDDKGELTISIAGKQITIHVADHIGKDFAIEGTPFSAMIENYWPDFRIEDGKPTSITSSPNNPAVVVTLRGHATPVAGQDHAKPGSESTGQGTPPPMSQALSVQNHLSFYAAENGSLSYELSSRKSGRSAGPIEIGRPLVTGWADWQIVVDRVLPRAERWMEFTPAKKQDANDSMSDGIRVRIEQNGQLLEQWIPAGWQIPLPTQPDAIAIDYGWKSIALPIGLELLDFEVARNEGSTSPAGFKSKLRISTADGQSAVGSCWMNHPFSFPSAWWRTWTGLTFKISQASWNPENLAQSTVQILRDPGWSLKWIGSLLIVTGVFMMFYVKKFRRASPTIAPPLEAIPARETKPHQPLVQVQ